MEFLARWRGNSIRDTLKKKHKKHKKKKSVNQMIGIMIGSIVLFGVIYFLVTSFLEGEDKR